MIYDKIKKKYEYFVISIHCGNIVCSYRIKRAMHINVQYMNETIDHLISKRIADAVNIHQQAIVFVLTYLKNLHILL